MERKGLNFHCLGWNVHTLKLWNWQVFCAWEATVRSRTNTQQLIYIINQDAKIVHVSNTKSGAGHRSSFILECKVHRNRLTRNQNSFCNQPDGLHLTINEWKKNTSRYGVNGFGNMQDVAIVMGNVSFLKWFPGRNHDNALEYSFEVNLVFW